MPWHYQDATTSKRRHHTLQRHTYVSTQRGHVTQQETCKCEKNIQHEIFAILGAILSWILGLDEWSSRAM